MAPSYIWRLMISRILATTARPLFTAQQAQTVLAGATYDFGPAKGYLQWYRAELDSARAATIKLHIWQLGTSVRAGDGDVLASWVRTAKEQVGVADQHRDTVTVAYDYRLSKRTDVYLALMRDKVTGLDRGNTSTLGLRHARRRERRRLREVGQCLLQCPDKRLPRQAQLP
eukprot:gene43256-58593_t